MVRRKSFVHQQKLMVAGFVVTILALIAYLTLETVTDEGAQGDFIAGIHYVELDKPRRIRGDAIEVMEFFSYGCIFCYRFDADLQDWASDKGDQVRLTQTPLIGSDQWRLLGAHYYALQDLDAPVALHQGTFRAIHDLGENSIILRTLRILSPVILILSSIATSFRSSQTRLKRKSA